jgi:predicted hotdog family 3-hydroxylacyl-ACP dehydratase
MTDLRSWAKRWNDASLRQIATLREPSPSRGWPLVGMFAIGLIAGAIGSYAVTQRSQIKRLATRVLTARREVVGDFGEVEAAKPVSTTTHRSNHRREAVMEVT